MTEINANWLSDQVEHSEEYKRLEHAVDEAIGLTQNWRRRTEKAEAEYKRLEAENRRLRTKARELETALNELTTWLERNTVGGSAPFRRLLDSAAVTLTKYA